MAQPQAGSAHAVLTPGVGAGVRKEEKRLYFWAWRLSRLLPREDAL